MQGNVSDLVRHTLAAVNLLLRDRPEAGTTFTYRFVARDDWPRSRLNRAARKVCW
jgi:hypothetical protein